MENLSSGLKTPTPPDLCREQKNISSNRSNGSESSSTKESESEANTDLTDKASERTFTRNMFNSCLMLGKPTMLSTHLRSLTLKEQKSRISNTTHTPAVRCATHSPFRKKRWTNSSVRERNMWSDSKSNRESTYTSTISSEAT